MSAPRRLYRVRWTSDDWTLDAWGGRRWHSRFYVMRYAAERYLDWLRDRGYRAHIETTSCSPWEVLR